jgi:hypothetical protein
MTQSDELDQKYINGSFALKKRQDLSIVIYRCHDASACMWKGCATRDDNMIYTNIVQNSW